MNRGRETAPLPLENMDRKFVRDNIKLFIGTKVVKSRGGHSLAILMDKQWAFFKGDLITVSVRKALEQDPPIKAMKRVTQIGNSEGFYCDHNWGLEDGDWVYITVMRYERKKHDHGDKDKEADQGLC